jgi:hypothetical protein
LDLDFKLQLADLKTEITFQTAECSSWPSERKPYAPFADPVKRVNNYARYNAMQQIQRSKPVSCSLINWRAGRIGVTFAACRQMTIPGKRQGLTSPRRLSWIPLDFLPKTN